MLLLVAGITPSQFVSADATVLLIVILVVFELSHQPECRQAWRLFVLCFLVAALLYALSAAIR